MKESLNEDKKSNEKPELGTFEYSLREGFILRKEISVKKIIEIENQYKENEVRKKAINDLEKVWDKMFLVKIPKDIMYALKDPKAFEVLIDGFLKEYKIYEVKEFLERTIVGLKSVKDSFNITKKNFLKHKINLERRHDMDPNDEEELKNRLEKKIKWIDVKLDKIENLIEYSKTKISTLL